MLLGQTNDVGSAVMGCLQGTPVGWRTGNVTPRHGGDNNSNSDWTVCVT